MITENILKNRKLFGSFDPVTYITTEAFDYVLKNKDLKYPWCIHMAYKKQNLINVGMFNKQFS